MSLTKRHLANARLLGVALAAAVGLSACATYDDDFARVNIEAWYRLGLYVLRACGGKPEADRGPRDPVCNAGTFAHSPEPERGGGRCAGESDAPIGGEKVGKKNAADYPEEGRDQRLC